MQRGQRGLELVDALAPSLDDEQTLRLALDLALPPIDRREAGHDVDAGG